jgi:transcriptional regulator with PAS, ATPase and Fis domain
MVKRGTFREDLFYRLNVITVRIPPLRERPEDIPLLIDHFLKKHGGGRVLSVDRRALRLLSSFSWPGNVRQLENEMMRASVLADDIIRDEHLSPEMIESGPEPEKLGDLDLKAQTARLERRLITTALERSGGNQSRASAALGVSRFGLQKKMNRYGIKTASSREQT